MPEALAPLLAVLVVLCLALSGLAFWLSVREKAAEKPARMAAAARADMAENNEGEGGEYEGENERENEEEKEEGQGSEEQSDAAELPSKDHAELAQNIRRLEKQADLLMLRGRGEEAKGPLLEILSLAPTHAGARVMLGKIFLDSGEAVRAEILFREALPTIAPRHAPQAKMLLAQTLTQLPAATPEHHKERADLLAQVCQQVAEPAVFREYAGALVVLDMHQEAQKALQEAMRLAPRDTDILRELMELLHANGQTTKARQLAKRLLEKRPNDERAQQLLGETPSAE